MPASPFDYRVCAGIFDLLPLVSQRLCASAVQLVFSVFLSGSVSPWWVLVLLWKL
jgi:hypothetical protein